jgi:hypothetical protein
LGNLKGEYYGDRRKNGRKARGLACKCQRKHA